MRIPPHIVDEIYRRADILEVVSDYVQLKRKGSYYVGLSPFKQERTPSFTVTPAKGIFKCFSTGKGGTVVNFLMEMEGLDYRDALVRLAERYQIDLPAEKEDESPQQKEQYESLYILNEFACKFYQQQLWETKEGQLRGLSYLRGRGLTDETIRAFELGYAPVGRDTFSRLALQKQYAPEALLITGLSKERGMELEDKFTGRVIFPIRNAYKKLAGFGARLLDPDTKNAKYLNSSESPVYNKSQLLYGFDTGLERIRELKEFILVEGYLDVLALHQAGFSQAVATCGTAATAEQLAQLKRWAKHAIILFDSDKAGQTAAVKAAKIALTQAYQTRFLQLPDGHDPDSFIQKFGHQSFTKTYESEQQDALDYMLKGIESNPNASPTEITDAAEEASKLIAYFPYSKDREIKIKELSNRIKIDERFIELFVEKERDQFKDALQQNSHAVKEKVTFKYNTTETFSIDRDADKELIKPNSPTWHSERELLRLLLNHYEDTVSAGQDEEEAEASAKVLMAYALKEQLDEVQFGDAAHERIRIVLFENVSGPSALQRDLRQLFDQESPEIQQQVAELLSVRHSLSPRFNDTGLLVPALDQDLQENIDRTLAHFTLRRINQLLRENADELKKSSRQGQSEEDVLKVQKLLKRKMLLEKKRRQITDDLGIVVL